MGQYVAPIRDMQFVLHEFLNVSEEFKNLPAYQEIDADIINQVLEEGAKFTQEVLFPLNHSGDREGCHFDATTKAEPQADGSYAITGSNIFISAGEHDLAENIVHLVLARLPDAPEGSKGISLVLVP